MIQAFTWVLNSLVLCILGKWTTFWIFTWVFCSLVLCILEKTEYFSDIHMTIL